MRDILICVTGGTPQIITETIYALSMKYPEIHLKELYVVTTEYGRKLIKERLLKEGILSQMLKEYGLPPINFTDENILVIKGRDGTPLDDIRNEDDNTSTGNLITEFIRTLAKDPELRLHCSLAGGRKTMSFYLGAALQMFGRPWDRLYHVLVSPEFENNPEFFYPPKKPRMIKCRLPDGTETLLSTAEAKVTIAELPFVRLRDKVPFREESFLDLVKEAQQSVDSCIPQLPLTLDFNRRLLRIGMYRVRLTPMQLALYAILAEQKTEHCSKSERPYCDDCTACYVDIITLSDVKNLQRLINFYKTMFGTKACCLDDERWKRYAKRGGIPHEVVRQHLSKINYALKRGIKDKGLHSLYTVHKTGAYGSTRYGIRIEKVRISFEPPTKR
jgi:CRISPR-associated protein (TIGR02584 family)